jgi:flagellar biosynthesis/type III secretory pathway chaperone
MQPELCRDHVEKLLSAEIRALTQLETLLDHEHEFLRRNDIESVDKACAARQQSMIELLRLEDERQALCRMLNYSCDLQGLESMLKWCDTKGSLTRLWEDCAKRAGRCRDHNTRNGALVAARMHRIEGVLGVLTGRSKNTKVYDPNGGIQSSGLATQVTVRV